MKQHQGNWARCKACDELVERLEVQGLTTSDATGVAMTDHKEAQDNIPVYSVFCKDTFIMLAPLDTIAAMYRLEAPATGRIKTETRLNPEYKCELWTRDSAQLPIIVRYYGDQWQVIKQEA